MNRKLFLTIIMCFALSSTCVLAIDMDSDCYIFSDNEPLTIVNEACECEDISENLGVDGPWVDGFLCSDDDGNWEYDNGLPTVDGAYSTLYSKYVEGEGLYVCNDWWNPQENPMDGCDAMNQFDFTDKSTDTFWRIIVHGKTEEWENPADAITVKYCPRSSDGTDWSVPSDLSEWEAYTGFRTSPRLEKPSSVSEWIPHYIWELKIPADVISSNIVLGLFDPKKTMASEPGGCPETAVAYAGPPITATGASTGFASLDTYGSAPTIELLDLVCGIDIYPPVPNPMTWATEPNASTSTSITMTATTATDHNLVQYFFDCTAGGGNDSGWQFSSTYTDTGLNLNTQYTYRFRARDISANYNTTGWSSSVTASPEATPPTPDPMTWASPPKGVNSTTITMMATTAEDSFAVEYYFECTAGGGNDSGWQDSPSYTDTGLSSVEHTYKVKARDKSSDQAETAYSATVSVTPMPTPPTPDPMAWASLPSVTNGTDITMAAVVATDYDDVEYYFECTAGGGNDSGWQDSRIYTDTGLTSNAQYSYKVKARDKGPDQTETAYSTEASCVFDDSPPTPDPMTWASPPSAVSTTSITMTATTATDYSGVEYYFRCVYGAGHNSGWQDSSTYTDTGLYEGQLYTYKVIARDKSPEQRLTDYSATASATP